MLAYLETELVILNIDLRFLILVESLDNALYLCLQLILKLLLLLTGKLDGVIFLFAKLHQFVDHLLGPRLDSLILGYEFEACTIDLQNSTLSFILTDLKHHCGFADRACRD